MRLSVLLKLALTGLIQAKYWMEDIGHHGISPYHNGGVDFPVFRNVKDFGAVGDGVTDDTGAINAAIAAADRCQPGICKGSVSSPATVYFPGGTYLVSTSIIDLYYTQLIGDPNDKPIIKATPNFDEFGFGLIDANPYQAGGTLAWNSTNTFFRQIRNLILDTTQIPPDQRAVGIHWPSSQATSITNCIFRLSSAPGNSHIGLFIEEGSGGLLNDLTFIGGGPAAVLGNQQYTARNLAFYNADVAISIPWNWGWTFKSLHIQDCRVGIEMDREKAATGSVTLLDSTFINTETAINTTRSMAATFGTNGTLAMEHVWFEGVSAIVAGPDGVVLQQSNVVNEPGSLFIMGHVADQHGMVSQTGYYDSSAAPRNGHLLDNDKYYERSKPLYEYYSASQVVSARDFGAKGDGNTDDTEALNTFFAAAAEKRLIAFLDAGIYLVSDTVHIPAESKIVGEALSSIIMGYGSNFQSKFSPRAIVQVGLPGDVGRIEWSDTLVSTQGPCEGAILIEYNIFSPEEPSGMWDIHTRIGGFPGTQLQLNDCPAIPGDQIANDNCIAAFMSVHITASAGGLFMENCWLWVADHDLEDPQYSRISIYAGRGMLVESQSGRIWLSATGSEHHVLYQYQLLNTRDVYMGHVQTESPYFQPEPLARYPFPVEKHISDPDFWTDCWNIPSIEPCESSWAMRIINSTGVVAYGAGLYSFFDSYDFMCSRDNSTRNCQERVLSVNNSNVKFLGLSTVASRVMVHQDGADLVLAKNNNSTFADTLALYHT